MKILVTGSSGYLGKPVVERLKKKHKIIEYDIVSGKNVLNYEKLKKTMKGSDIVIHLAAIPKPDESRSFDDYFQINCIGTLNIAKAAAENGVKRLIYVSSTTYYGVERGIPVKFPLKEGNRTVPMYLKADNLRCRDCDVAYSESKIIAENVLAFYGLLKKIQIIILRFPRIGDKEGPYGTKVSMSNAIQGVEKAVECKKALWYEAFNIADRLKNVDVSKAKNILGYMPE